MENKPEGQPQKVEEQNNEKKDWAEMSDDDGDNEATATNEDVKKEPEPEN